MVEPEKTTLELEQTSASWRFHLGVALFILSIALPLFGVPVLASLQLSVAKTASVSGILLVGSEVLGILAVAVMGKSGFAYIKNRLFGFLKQYGPPKEVSRLRYTIGLVMFSVPILFGWLSIYATDLIPGFTKTPLPFAVGGDLLLLSSLFVLGGNFWDKVRALFFYNAEVHFSKR